MAKRSRESILILLTLATLASAEILKPPQPPQYRYVFQKFRTTPPPEASFFQRITNWVFPWGGVRSEEEIRLQASSKSDTSEVMNSIRQYSFNTQISPVHVRDTEPTTQTPLISKCSPCNKVPWIPVIPAYHQPVVNAQPNQHQVYYNQHFGNDDQYTQISKQPSSTIVPTLLKYKNVVSNVQNYAFYGVPTIRNTQFKGYEHTTKFSEQPKATTLKPNINTIDTSVITFTTSKSPYRRPLRFTVASSVTNPEYILPPNRLPLEGENSQMAPIPIPNLSPTPIPPLFDSKNFHHNPYRSQKVGFIKLVPLEPTAQLSTNINIHVKPDQELQKPAVEILNSNLVAEFTIPENINPVTDQQSLSNKKYLDIDDNLKSSVGNSYAEADNVGEGSETNYHHKIKQFLDDGADDFETFDEGIDSKQAETITGLRKSIETTTTKAFYKIQFEPSVQTAADLLEFAFKSDENGTSKYHERKTPLEILDSPIFHVTSLTVKPLVVTYSTESTPSFKPIDNFTKKLASPLPLSLSSTEYTSSTSLPTLSTTPSTFSDMSESREVVSTTSHSFTKKPKQIQLVIPYTTFHKPSPFKKQEEQEILTYRPIRGHYVTYPSKKSYRQKNEEVKNNQFNGLGYNNDQEYPDHAEESKVVERKVTTELPKVTKYLTKILANNIRELLQKEKTPKSPKIDIIRLQKNIDGWTEQSYLGKVSTISQNGHTKAIPVSFLSASTSMSISTTTISPNLTFEPELIEATKQQYGADVLEKDLFVKRHDRFLNRDNEIVLINNNLTKNLHQNELKILDSQTTLTQQELWKRLPLTTSPLTNEKIYIVTPQPTQKLEENVFKPRFSKRPTIGGSFILKKA